MNIRFGPAGNSEEFYDEGNKSSLDAPLWIKNKGLNAFEYSFGRGVKLKEDTALELGKRARECGIAMSAHSPYYINLTATEPEKIEKNHRYIFDTCKIAKIMGADRVVLHPGSCAKIDRKVAFEQNLKGFKEMLQMLKDNGLGDILVCPETMGKLNQIGDVEEIIAMCNINENIIPTIDFGHVNCRMQGGLRAQEDFKMLLDKLENGIGKQRLDIIHCHFSRIEFTEKGEKRHWTYDDVQFGPDFDPLAKELARRKMSPRIICESKGTMAKDAVTLKNIYENALKSI